jgi:hypothetical protein
LNFSADLYATQDNEIIRRALVEGTDLRKYGQQIEAELLELEGGAVSECKE